MTGSPAYLQHVNVMVDDIDEADDFYAGTLGLERDATPPLDFPARFYRVGDGQQIHVNQLSDTKPTRAHLALRFDDFNAVFRRCYEAGVVDTAPWGLVKRIGGGIWQAFARDPSGNLVEIASLPGAELDPDLRDLEVVDPS